MKTVKKIISAVIIVSILASFMIGAASAAGSIAYGAATVSATCLNMRSGPSTTSSIIGAISKGTKIIVLEQASSTWYYVNYNGNKGYVAARYLEDVTRAENFYATGIVTGDTVRMRTQPSLDGNIIRTYDYGETMAVIGINNGWYKLVNGSNVGYMRSDYIDVVSGYMQPPKGFGSTPTPTPSPEPVPSNLEEGEAIAQFALQFEGYSYVYGAESPSEGFDCSGLVYYVYNHFGYSVTRTSSSQYDYDGVHISKDELQPGDLVFFSDNGGEYATHVGIYIGDDEFIHASTSRTGVIISSLNSSYYQTYWYGAKRIVQ